jgi:N-acyl-D-aspartate/D-glutamate deacylase
MSKYDLVIKNGTVVDGLQRPRYKSDLAIKDGRIVHIGPVRSSDGERVIDATGLIVAPGFVDCHTHYDAQIQWDPYCTMSGWHGVTTVAVGNCGFGFAPCPPESRERAMLMMERNEQIALESMREGMRWDWVTFPEWLDSLERMPKGVNVVSYVPLNPIMIWTMGLEESKQRGATAAEREQMKQLVHEGMDAGAVGWSVQRLGENSIQGDADGTPMPTDTMTDEDCMAMAEVLAERGGEGVIQMTQFKDYGDLSADSTDLAFQKELIRKTNGASLFYNVVLTMPGEAAVMQRSRIAWIDGCRAEGLDVYGQGATVFAPTVFRMDRYNQMDNSPAWKEATLGTVEEKIAKFRDPARRAKMREEQYMWEGDPSTGGDGNGFGGLLKDALVKTSGGHPELEQFVGRSLEDIANELGKDVLDTFLDIAADSGLQADFETKKTSVTRDPDLLAEVANHPAIVPGLSDGGAHTQFVTMGHYPTQTLTYLVREHGKMTLEQAHYKLSYLPAQFAGIKDRGFILEGAPADLVIYDFENLKVVPEFGFEVAYDQPAGQWRRVNRPEGYRWIVVNGTVTFEDGACTDATPGQLLRHGRGENGQNSGALTGAATGMGVQ